MLNKKTETCYQVIVLIGLFLLCSPKASFGQSSLKYGKDIPEEPSVRYGVKAEESAKVRYGVDIRMEDIRIVKPGEAPPEEVISDFKFDVRAFVKSGWIYRNLKDDSVINPNNLLNLGENTGLITPGLQFKATYLKDYVFNTDIEYQLTFGDGDNDATTHFLVNDFYFDLYLADFAYLKAGKKRESWSVGWTFTPVDQLLEIPKNPIDPSDSREGKYLVKMEMPVKSASFGFIYFPDVAYELDENGNLKSETGKAGIPDEWFNDDPGSNYRVDEGGYGVRSSLLAWETDIALMYYRTDKIPDLMKDYFGLSLTRYWLDLGAYIEIIGHKGKDLSTVRKNTKEGTLPGQRYAIVSDEDDDDFYTNFAIGVNYSFSDDSKIAIEYYRNAEGYDSEEFDLFYEFLKHDSDLYLTTHDRNVGNKILRANQILGDRVRQNYLSFTFDRPNTFDDFFPHIGVIICLDDGSTLINGALEYTVRDDTSIKLDTRWYLGDDDSEFGLKPSNFEGILKLIYYF